ncbi:MAG: ABC transporter permease [Spirochaetota bacterium]
MKSGENATAKAAAESPTALGFKRFFRRYSMQIGILFVGIFIWLLFLAAAPRTFLSSSIYISFMSTTPFFALMAIPLTYIIIVGEIDLSFPSIMSLGMLAFDVTYTVTGNVWVGFLSCILAGAIAGYLNGVLVVKIGIPSLVATIGTQYLWRGVILVVTNGQGMGMTPIQDTILYPLFVGRIGGVVPAQFAWTIGIALVLWLILNRTRFGAHVYLTGDNIASARLMGVNVDSTKIWSFVILGVAAAFAGFVVSEEVLYYWPTLGEGYMMNTLASVFLGGTSPYGGTGTILGTFIACFIIGAINAGIVAAGMTAFWTNVIYGLIVLISVSLQAVLIKRLK